MGWETYKYVLIKNIPFNMFFYLYWPAEKQKEHHKFNWKFIRYSPAKIMIKWYFSSKIVPENIA